MQQPGQGELREGQVARGSERAQRLQGRQMFLQVLLDVLVAFATTAGGNGAAQILFGEQALRQRRVGNQAERPLCTQRGMSRSSMPRPSML